MLSGQIYLHLLYSDTKTLKSPPVIVINRYASGSIRRATVEQLADFRRFVIVQIELALVSHWTGATMEDESIIGSSVSTEIVRFASVQGYAAIIIHHCHLMPLVVNVFSSLIDVNPMLLCIIALAPCNDRHILDTILLIESLLLESNLIRLTSFQMFRR